MLDTGSDQKGHFLRDGEATHYTEIRCEEDELARMWALCPRDG